MSCQLLRSESDAPVMQMCPWKRLQSFQIDNGSRNVKFFTTKLRDFTCYGGGSGDKELDD